MEEICIGFGEPQKRAALLRMAGLAALVAVVGVVLYPSGNGNSPWLVPVVLTAGLALAATTLAKRAWGTTLLTQDGVVLRPLLQPSRSVPWDRTTRIEVKRRSGLRGTAWMVVRVHLADGSAVELPGLQQSGLGQSKEEFQEQVGVILGYWQQATGRTEKALVTL